MPMEWLETRTEGAFTAELLKVYFNTIIRPLMTKLKEGLGTEGWKNSTKDLVDPNKLLVDEKALILVRVDAARVIALTLNRLEQELSDRQDQERYEVALQGVLMSNETLFNILQFLSLADGAKLAATNKWTWQLYKEFPLSNDSSLKNAIVIRDVHQKLSSGTSVGLHSTSSNNMASLFKGLRVPNKEEQVSDFNQLGSGFYISDGFSNENVHAVETFGKESVTQKGGQVVMLRVYISGWSGLTSTKVPESQWVKEQRDVGKLSKQIKTNNESYDYLKADIHKFPGATQIKLNPSLIGEIGKSIEVTLVPTPNSFNEELWMDWLKYMFPDRFK
ncbi:MULTISPECIES: hypothetical protein [unclassified Corallococcus]|uniref:hypothetical protein n=1 Tax=unclassified Corallococcus TaxID=2685029 RepID=UPI001A8E229F|nr:MULTISPECIES: hypothetical protein [unclassified Corallococcus]MBN9687177.1 hypothetical protein [Corallococcus sp. NCSPR001]WAS88996.1 hypothetical protein O0N60_18935 [Corallococcus sp. NCRR]